jgi:tetratricopeptide (TPR) repeat protein
VTYFWILVGLLVTALLGLIVFVGGQLMGRERRMIHQAEEKIERGREEEAVTILSRLTDLNPANFQARWRLAKLLQMMGQYGAAAYHFEYCLEHDALPGHVRIQDALVRLAQVYEDQGHEEDAADAWTRYLQQDPDSMEGYFRRAQCFYRQREYDRAIADLKKIRSDFAEEEPEQVALYLGRCFRRKEQFEKAIDYYEEYLEAQPDDLEAAVEAAQGARSVDREDLARRWFNHVRDRADDRLYAEATVKLAELAFEQEQLERAEDRVEELETMHEEERLTSRQLLDLKYLRAWQLEYEDRHDEAVDIYWDIYEQRPEFRDVDRIIEEEIGKMDAEDLLEGFMNCDRERFVEQGEEIVALMGFEVIKSDAFSPYELNVTAREEGRGLDSDRILVTFKRWESELGEWPIREFELDLLEDRYDRGIFVAPHGFQSEAEDFAKDSSIRLIGPDTLIQYLREAHKHIK